VQTGQPVVDFGSHRIAIVHEWFSSMAGSERVVEQILAILPQAELFSLVDFLPEGERGWLRGKSIGTTFLQRLPFARKRFRGYLPLMPSAIEQLDLDRFDIVISSNHCVAKGCLTRADQLHVSYVHTPIRYAWDLQHEYLKHSKLTWGLRSMIARGILHYLRLWDRASADRVDAYAANSQYVAKRIGKTYRRDAAVVYPPVDVSRFTLRSAKEDFFVAASRLVPYKRIDAIVEAFRLLPDQRLIVIGDGPEMAKIRKLAGSNVQLLGYQSNAALCDHLQRAAALVFAADEDFGILPVEAQACGTPVIALGRGGSCETVVDGVTGTFFSHAEPDVIASAVRAFLSRRPSFRPSTIRAHAEQFSHDAFRNRFMVWLTQAWHAHQARLRLHAIDELDPADHSPFTPSYGGAIPGETSTR
jgi:glycosyltransferase involved in cell wall biosynthesis